MIALCAVHPWALATAQTPEPAEQDRLAAVSDASCVLAGSETKFAIKLTGIRAPRPTIQWTLSAQNNRVLGRFSKVVRNDTPGKELTVDLTIPAQHLEPGVVLPIELRVVAPFADRRRERTFPLTLFSEHAFVGRGETIKQLQLQLYDPAGATAERFDALGLPYSRLINLAAVDLVESELLVIGEGVSLGEQRGLGEALLRAVLRGANVLCLAPADGAFTPPAEHNPSEHDDSKLTLESANVIRRFDKRFDTRTWGSQSSISARLTSRRINGEPVLAVSTNELGWPWCELDLQPTEQPAGQASRPQGRLIVCGLGVIARWDDSPVPRHLLAHLLNEFAGIPSQPQEQRHATSKR